MSQNFIKFIIICSVVIGLVFGGYKFFPNFYVNIYTRIQFPKESQFVIDYLKQVKENNFDVIKNQSSNNNLILSHYAEYIDYFNEIYSHFKVNDIKIRPFKWYESEGVFKVTGCYLNFSNVYELGFQIRKVDEGYIMDRIFFLEDR